MHHVNCLFSSFHRIHSVIALDGLIMHQHSRYSMRDSSWYQTRENIRFGNPWKVILLSPMPLASIPYIFRTQNSDIFIYLPAVSTAMIMVFARHQFFGGIKKKKEKWCGGWQAIRWRESAAEIRSKTAPRNSGRIEGRASCTNLPYRYLCSIEAKRKLNKRRKGNICLAIINSALKAGWLQKGWVAEKMSWKWTSASKPLIPAP